MLENVTGVITRDREYINGRSKQMEYEITEYIKSKNGEIGELMYQYNSIYCNYNCNNIGDSNN